MEPNRPARRPFGVTLLVVLIVLLLLYSPKANAFFRTN